MHRSLGDDYGGNPPVPPGGSPAFNSLLGPSILRRFGLPVSGAGPDSPFWAPVGNFVFGERLALEQVCDRGLPYQRQSARFGSGHQDHAVFFFFRIESEVLVVHGPLSKKTRTHNNGFAPRVRSSPELPAGSHID